MTDIKDNTRLKIRRAGTELNCDMCQIPIAQGAEFLKMTEIIPVAGNASVTASFRQALCMECGRRLFPVFFRGK